MTQIARSCLRIVAWMLVALAIACGRPVATVRLVARAHGDAGVDSIAVNFAALTMIAGNRLTVLGDPEIHAELVALAQSQSPALLAEADGPAAPIDRVRLEVDPINGLSIVSNGATIVPDGPAGIAFATSFLAPPDGLLVMQLDFDLDGAVHRLADGGISLDLRATLTSDAGTAVQLLTP